MLPLGPWSFVGLIAGLWKLAVLAAGIGLFVWKKGLWRHPAMRLLVPWVLRTAEPTTGPAPGPTVARPRPARPAPARAAADRGGRPVAPVHPVLAHWKTLVLIAAALALLAWVLFQMSIPDATPAST